LLLFAVAQSELNFERACSLELDAIVESCAGGEGVGPKAGARVIDFKQLDLGHRYGSRP